MLKFKTNESIKFYFQSQAKCYFGVCRYKRYAVLVRLISHKWLPSLEQLLNPFDEAKNEPLLRGHLSPELNLFDQILP